MKSHDDMNKSNERINELEKKNHFLMDQVKRLIQTEHALYSSQSQIDKQLKLYHSLFETGRVISSSQSSSKIIFKLIHFALYELEFERCLAVEPTESDSFKVVACDGFYDDKSITTGSLIKLDNTIINELNINRTKPIIVLKSDSNYKLIRENLQLHDFAVYPIYGHEENPDIIIITGNSQKRSEFYSELKPGSILLSVFMNLILQASDSMMTLNYLEELKIHRSNLESQIQKRTKELERSNSILLDEITERKTTENQLKKALNEIDTLEGLFPICSNCKSVRDSSGNWKNIEQYISTHSKAEFSHSLCPDCLKSLYPDYFPDKP